MPGAIALVIVLLLIPVALFLGLPGLSVCAATMRLEPSDSELYQSSPVNAAPSAVREAAGRSRG